MVTCALENYQVQIGALAMVFHHLTRLRFFLLFGTPEPEGTATRFEAVSNASRAAHVRQIIDAHPEVIKIKHRLMGGNRRAGVTLH